MGRSALEEMLHKLDEAGARGLAGHVLRRRGEPPLEATYVRHADGILEEAEHRSVVRRVAGEHELLVCDVEIEAETLRKQDAAGRELVVAAEPAVDVDPSRRARRAGRAPSSYPNRPPTRAPAARLTT